MTVKSSPGHVSLLTQSWEQPKKPLYGTVNVRQGEPEDFCLWFKMKLVLSFEGQALGKTH